MKIYQGYQEINACYPKSIITVGNYDGLHLGHRQIIEAVRDRAKAEKGTSVVYTFKPHPQSFLSPGTQIPLLNTYEEKLKLLEECGIDVVVEEPFGREFSTVSPEKFFREILVKRLCAFAVYVGYDFGFGNNRAGSLELLQKMCSVEGVEVKVFKPLKIGDQICSSSQIRKYISTGDVHLANKLLGREFFYSGHIVKGNGRGRTIGFATANVHTGSNLWIKEGVYATRAVLKGKTYLSVTNIGRQPTFNTDSINPVVMESHLLNFDSDIYGETLDVKFIQRLRDEKKFASIDELVKQINLDIQTAKQYYS